MLNAEDVERQAANTAAYWMERAIDEINSLSGDGYAKKPPELVAAFMNSGYAMVADSVISARTVRPGGGRSQQKSGGNPPPAQAAQQQTAAPQNGEPFADDIPF